MFHTLVEVAVYATILGVFLTIGAWLNGRRTTKMIERIIKSEGEATREMVERVIKSEAEATRKILDRIDERAEERHREVIKLIKV